MAPIHIWLLFAAAQGHVWQSKGFPTKRGGKRRSEAKRLLRVLELMKADHARCRGMVKAPSC